MLRLGLEKELLRRTFLEKRYESYNFLSIEFI